PWTRSLGRWPTRRPSRALRPVNLAAWIGTSAFAFGPPPWSGKRNKPKSCSPCWRWPRPQYCFGERSERNSTSESGEHRVPSGSGRRGPPGGPGNSGSRSPGGGRCDSAWSPWAAGWFATRLTDTGEAAIPFATHRCRRPRFHPNRSSGGAFMKVTRRELLKGAAEIGVLGELPLALTGAAQAQTTQKKELVTAQAGDIAKFDPHFSTASQAIRVSFNLFDNLTSRHPDGKLYPGLATEWKLEGQTTWRFKLRQAVKFHNGDPFTSADAKFSLERTYDPGAKTMVATVFTTIERIEAPDPFTLVFHTKKPDPLLPARLAF